MIIIGVDPGPEESAYVVWDGESIVEHGNVLNEHLASGALARWKDDLLPGSGQVAIEQIRGFGVPAGNKLFDTCFWTGRFVEALGEPLCRLMPRKQVFVNSDQSWPGSRSWF